LVVMRNTITGEGTRHSQECLSIGAGGAYICGVRVRHWGASCYEAESY